MASCTAPVRGHRSAAAAAECPVCRYRSRYGGYSSGYSSNSPSTPSYNSTSYSNNSGGSRSGSKPGRSSKPRWSRASSPIFYTPAEVQTLTPIRQTVESRAALPDLKDIFLCHAWDDRQGSAKELYNLLISKGVSVWFSEKDVNLGEPLMRAIDKGLANSRIGLVLVTPAFLLRLQKEGIADKELSALLHRNQLIPIVHNTTYEALREVSPLLGSRSGLDTSEESMSEIAAKLGELVAVEPNCENA